MPSSPSNSFEAPRPPATARLSRVFGSWLGHESIPQLAAALAYRTVFALVPIAVIALLTLRLVADEDKIIRGLFTRVLDLVGLSALSDSQEVSVQGKLEELISQFSQVSFAGIGIVSAVTLIYAAIGLLIEVETAFNKIFGVTRGRSAVRRITQYWLMVSLGPLLVFASFYAQDRLLSIAKELGSGWVVGLGGYFSGVLLTALLLWVIYTVVPNAKVRPRHALTGAVIGSLLLEAAKFGFQVYLANASFKTLYSSLALLPLFLLWIYITWMIVLVGLRLAYLSQFGKRAALLSWTIPARESPWVDPAVAIRVARVVAQNFAIGQTTTVEQVALASDLRESSAARCCKHLIEAEYFRTLSDGRQTSSDLTPESRLTLARPAETILLTHLLQVGFGLAGETEDPLLLRLRQSQLEALAAPASPDASTPQTLADLLARSPGSSQKSLDSQPAADSDPTIHQQPA